jgi:hypothetical protein
MIPARTVSRANEYFTPKTWQQNRTKTDKNQNKNDYRIEPKAFSLNGFWSLLGLTLSASRVGDLQAAYDAISTKSGMDRLPTRRTRRSIIHID